jgi:hypothetical protein
MQDEASKEPVRIERTWPLLRGNAFDNCIELMKRNGPPRPIKKYPGIYESKAKLAQLG